MAILEIINATDSLIQNIIMIVSLCWLIFDILTNKNPGDHAELRAPLYQNQTSFPDTPFLWNEAAVTPNF